MPDGNFRFARVSSADGEVLWHVTQDSRFLGTVAEVGGSYRATLLAPAANRGPGCSQSA